MANPCSCGGKRRAPNQRLCRVCHAADMKRRRATEGSADWLIYDAEGLPQLLEQARESEGAVSDFEFYETPQTFTRYLFRQMRELRFSISGNVFEPCVGSNGIPRAYSTIVEEFGGSEFNAPWNVDRWITNDIDRRWGNADQYMDATQHQCWLAAMGLPPVSIDWTVSNPPFTPAIDIITNALRYSRVGVAMHLRASIHEVLKTGIRRTFLHDHTPTGILWLPRFAYQRSKTTGAWKTDSVCACFVIWLKDTEYITHRQFIRYAPEWVLDELEAETPLYRERMDRLMGYTGTEHERREQRKAA